MQPPASPLGSLSSTSLQSVPGSQSSWQPPGFKPPLSPAWTNMAASFLASCCCLASLTHSNRPHACARPPGLPQVTLTHVPSQTSSPLALLRPGFCVHPQPTPSQGGQWKTTLFGPSWHRPSPWSRGGQHPRSPRANSRDSTCRRPIQPLSFLPAMWVQPGCARSGALMTHPSEAERGPEDGGVQSSLERSE